jgi:hypothetical protein
MRPSQLFSIFEREFIRAKQGSHTPVMVWGPPGIGKSQLVADVAVRHGVPIIDVRLSQMEPSDLRGIPFRTEDRGTGKGEGSNINVPLLPGGGHDAYMYAMQRIVTPAIERFSPDLIVVASGLDANSVDPLARMLARSGTFKALTEQTMELADQLCAGRLVLVHEGGYAESSVPFCAHAILEALCGESSNVDDPTLEMFAAWQPNERVVALQRQIIDEMAGN